MVNVALRVIERTGSSRVPTEIARGRVTERLSVALVAWPRYEDVYPLS